MDDRLSARAVLTGADRRLDEPSSLERMGLKRFLVVEQGTALTVQLAGILSPRIAADLCRRDADAVVLHDAAKRFDVILISSEPDLDKAAGLCAALRSKGACVAIVIPAASSTTVHSAIAPYPYLVAPLSAAAIESLADCKDRSAVNTDTSQLPLPFGDQVSASWKVVLDQLHEGVIVTDPGGRIIFVNEAAANLHGVRALDIAPQGYAQTYHLFTEDGAPYPFEQLPLSRAVLTGENVTGERWRIRRPDGTEIIAVGSARRIYSDSGSVLGAALTLRDDTQRHISQRQLQQSEERFRTLADNIPTLCWMANADGWIFWYNKRWYDYTGTNFESMQGWGWASVHDPDVLPAVTERWQESLRTGQKFEMVFPLKGEDGKFRPFLTRVVPIRDDNGKVRLWFGTNTEITEIRNAQRKLADSEARLKSILDVSPVAIVELSPDGQIDFANSMAEAILGIGQGRAPAEGHTFGMPSSGMTSADGRPLEASDLPAARALRGETIVNAEFAIIEPATGQRRVLNVNSVPRKQADGSVTGALAAFVDITTRYKAEAALAASERRFQAITDSMPQMVWSALPNGFHDYFNSRWHQFTGVAEGSTLGDGWTALFHPDDRDHALQRWRHSLATGEPYETEYRLKHRSGLYRWVLGLALPIRNERGAIERWFGTCTDIHEQREARDALQESQRRLRSLIEVSPQVVWFAEPDGTITYVNAYWSDYTGLTLDDTKGGGWSNAIQPDHRDRVAGIFQQAIANRSPYEAEIPFRRGSDGQYRWFIARGVPVEDENGMVVQWIGMALDIHDRRQAEDALELVSRELSHRIKNIFALVMGLASITGRDHPAASAYVVALRARLDALAKAHDLVRPQREQAGSAERTSLHTLLRTLVAPYDISTEPRVSIEGEDILIGLKAATSLALIIHEQATNAAKYGSLSSSSGRVTIATRITGETLDLIWQETGGPEIDGAPEKKGFGTVLASRTVTAQLGGNVDHKWDRGGLSVTLSLPIGKL